MKFALRIMALLCLCAPVARGALPTFNSFQTNDFRRISATDKIALQNPLEFDIAIMPDALRVEAMYFLNATPQSFAYIDSDQKIASAPFMPQPYSQALTDVSQGTGTSGLSWMTGPNGTPGWQLTDIFDVQRFGAVGDGVTDDSAAIQAAISATPAGSTLQIPTGIYLVTNSIIINKNMTVVGPGTIKRCDNAAAATIIIGAAGDYATLDGVAGGTELVTVKFANLKFDCNREGNPNAMSSWPHLQTMLYSVNGYKTLTVENCDFRGHSLTAIYCAGPFAISDSSITDSAYMTGVQYQNPIAILGYPSSDSNPSDRPLTFDMHNCYLAGEPGESVRNSTGAILFFNKGVTYDYANFSNNKMYHQREGIGTYNGAKNVSIIGNTVWYSGLSGIKVQRSQRARIVGNSVVDTLSTAEGATGTSTCYGIIVDGTAREGAAPWVGEYAGLGSYYDYIVSGNTVSGYRGYGILTINSADNAIISDNLISGGVKNSLNACVGINIRASNATVTGNRMRDIDGIGIEVLNSDDPTHNAVITANSIECSDAGIRVANGATNAIVSDNVILTSATIAPAIYISDATNVTISANTTYGGLNGIRIDSTSANVASEGNKLFSSSATAHYNESTRNIRSTMDSSDGAAPVWRHDVNGGNVWATTTLAILAGDNPASLMVRSDAGNSRNIAMQTGVTNRWLIQADSDAESGSNAGSNLRFVSHDDEGNVLYEPFIITRSTGAAQFNGPLILNNTLTLKDNTRITFNPGANESGLNVGVYPGDPDTIINGDVWYNGTAHEYRGMTNGVKVTFNVTPVP